MMAEVKIFLDGKENQTFNLTGRVVAAELIDRAQIEAIKRDAGKFKISIEDRTLISGAREDKIVEYYEGSELVKTYAATWTITHHIDPLEVEALNRRMAK